METIVTDSTKFGWGWSCTPTGEDAYSIKTPSKPDYEGTLEKLRKDIANDQAFQNLGGAFYNTAWFYDGKRILKTRAYGVVKDRTTPAINEDGTHNWRNDDTEYGYRWLNGWQGDDHGDLIRIIVED